MRCSDSEIDYLITQLRYAHIGMMIVRHSKMEIRNNPARTLDSLDIAGFGSMSILVCRSWTGSLPDTTKMKIRRGGNAPYVTLDSQP